MILYLYIARVCISIHYFYIARVNFLLIYSNLLCYYSYRYALIPRGIVVIFTLIGYVSYLCIIITICIVSITLYYYLIPIYIHRYTYSIIRLFYLKPHDT